MEIEDIHLVDFFYFHTPSYVINTLRIEFANYFEIRFVRFLKHSSIFHPK